MESVQITMLGTGATTPTLARGLWSQLVQIGGTRVLIDCGEGTQLALLRHAGMGAALVDELLLTHYHADHYLGIAGLVKTRSSAGADIKPLTIRCLPKVAAQLREHLRTARVGRGAQIITIDPGEHTEIAPGWDVQAVGVKHGEPSLGFALRERDLPGRLDATRARADGCPSGPTMGRLARGEKVKLPDGRVLDGAQYIGAARTGRKIVISGDTAYSDDLALAASGAQLVVHEATFAHADHAIACGKGHCTARDAGRLALAAGAGELWLSHLSARYDPSKREGITWDDLLSEAREAAGADVVCRLTRDGLHATIGESVNVERPTRGRFARVKS
jgi:ribonuclease Z